MTESIHQRLHEAAAALGGGHITLSRLADLHGPAAQGTLLVLLAVPCMLPMPGVGSVLGLGLALLAAAMWRGQDTCQLPGRMAEVELPDLWARRVLLMLARFYEMASRLARSRLKQFVQPGPRSWLAAKTALMAVLIILPIPLGNLLPALALVLLGLGLVFGDGLAVLLSAALAAAAVVYAVALTTAICLWGLAPVMQRLQT